MNDGKQTHALGETKMTKANQFDQIGLARLVLKASCPDVRLWLVQRITDQAVLAQVATSDVDQGVRQAAVERLIDQVALAPKE